MDPTEITTGQVNRGTGSAAGAALGDADRDLLLARVAAARERMAKAGSRFDSCHHNLTRWKGFLDEAEYTRQLEQFMTRSDTAFRASFLNNLKSTQATPAPVLLWLEAGFLCGPCVKSMSDLPNMWRAKCHRTGGLQCNEWGCYYRSAAVAAVPSWRRYDASQGLLQWFGKLSCTAFRCY